MSEGIIIAAITGVFSFGASLIANSSSNKKLVNDLKLEVTKNQAITDTKIDDNINSYNIFLNNLMFFGEFKEFREYSDEKYSKSLFYQYSLSSLISMPSQIP